MKRRRFLAALAGLALAPFAAQAVAKEPEVLRFDNFTDVRFRGHKLVYEPYLDSAGIDPAGKMRWKNYTAEYRNPPDKAELIAKIRKAMRRTRFVRPLEVRQVLVRE